jgi:hypothetical protein
LDLVAFSLWMELILDVDGGRCTLLTDELANRYSGFAFSRLGLSSGEAVRELNSWAVQNTLRVDNENVLAALSWHVRNNPAYYSLRNYATDCHAGWSDRHPSRLCSFEEWRRAADDYVSRS